MLGGNPEFARRKVEVSSDESLTLLGVSFDKLRNRHFGRLRDRLGGGNNSLFLPLGLWPLATNGTQESRAQGA